MEPVAMDLPDISITETDNQIFLRGQPNSARATVDVAMLHKLLADFGAAACVLDEAAIAMGAEYCNTLQTPFVLQLAERQNATIVVHVAPDDMSAAISITPARGGHAATVQDVAHALTSSGVVFGIDEAATRQVCAAGSCDRVPVAHGTVPVDGTDAVFEALMADMTDRAPKVDENGLIDYREHGSIELVTAGMLLMRRHPATPGTDGSTVRGRVLPARPGRDEPFASKLPGTQLRPNDANMLEAAITGQPVHVRCGVMVEPVLKVAEVNMASGNIHFDGTVEIKGDVVQGMKVQAGGDIVVSGMVDGGILEATGNIRIAGGVVALAQVRAGGAVSAKFAQGVQIQAGTVLTLSDMALECELLSFNQIVIGAANPGRGRLVGGSATAMMLLSVPVLGSATSAVTKITMGVNAQLVERMAELEARIEQEKASEEALGKLVKQMVAAKDPKGVLPRIQASRQHAVQVWGKSLAEKKALEEEIALAASAKVKVTAEVQGAADLVFGNHLVRLRREFSNGTFSVDPTTNLVVFTDASGHPVSVE